MVLPRFQVVKIDRERGRVFVTYVYWESRFDEWITSVPERFAPLHTHTYAPVNGVLKVGQRVEARDERGMWMEAFVVDENPLQVLYKDGVIIVFVMCMLCTSCIFVHFVLHALSVTYCFGKAYGFVR